MADKPVPFVVTTSGDAAGAPDGAVPVAFYGGVPETTIAGIAGLEARLTDIEGRLTALETPAG